jgi:predicted amidohydrolase
MKVRIAVVQFPIRQFDPPGNLKRAEAYIRNASAKGAQIIAFPEDFLTGPVGKRPDLADNAHQYRDRFIAWARKYKIDIVAGSVIEREGKNLFNTCYYVDAGGKVLGRYRKVNLWVTEKTYMTPGKEAVVVKTRYGRIGLTICWDLIFPEIFRSMMKKGAQIVFCVTLWKYKDAGRGVEYNPNAEIEAVNSLCTARAFENEIAVIFCNAAGKLGGPSGKERLVGRSQIALPFLGSVRRFDHEREGMFIREIDTDVLSVAENAYQIKQDLRKNGRL